MSVSRCVAAIDHPLFRERNQLLRRGSASRPKVPHVGWKEVEMAPADGRPAMRRATDHASNQVRRGRMSRECAIDMVPRYNHVRLSDVDLPLTALA
jgi:hypothetical protein